MSARKPKVLVAMSGGVDSSVAAALLVDQGYEVVGVTMQVWDYSKCDIEEGSGTCCSSLDVDDARSVADILGIPFYVANCESQFKEKVIDPFVASYMRGETPLPCVNCNTFLKFDHLVKKMRELECDYLATGHYARIETSPSGKPGIVTSTDSWKDQTYFLFTLEPDLVGKLMFPIGHLTKPEVREIAIKKNLVVAKKRDSTGICFVGNVGYENFINEHYPLAPKKTGVIKQYPEGNIIAEHEGIHLFTYGQRKGLGFSSDRPLYVYKVDAESGDVWVAEEKDLYQGQLVMENCHWLDDWQEEEKFQIKIRYSQKTTEASIKRIENNKCTVDFTVPQRAVTPGQACVVYRGQQLLGGGWIK